MMVWISNIIRIIDRFNEWIGRSVSWLTGILVVLVCVDVFARYLLGDTYNWINDLEWHLFSLVFLLGAGYTYKHNKHVRVDLFYTRFSVRDQAWVQLFGGILFLLPWCLVITWFSFEFTRISWMLKETSPNPGGLPARYVIKMAIPLGFTMLGLQGLADVLRAVLVLRQKKD